MVSCYPEVDQETPLFLSNPFFMRPSMQAPLTDPKPLLNSKGKKWQETKEIIGRWATILSD